MSEKQERVFSFGKYKGQEVKYIILTHIGCIMWYMDNIQWFKLTEEEQALYDAIAIAIKKYNCQMTFPVELMYKHIKNKEAYERLKTPFMFHDGFVCFECINRDDPVCKSVEKYISSTSLHRSLSFPNFCSGLLHSENKEVYRACCDGDTDEEIFGYE